MNASEQLIGSESTCRQANPLLSLSEGGGRRSMMFSAVAAVGIALTACTSSIKAGDVAPSKPIDVIIGGEDLCAVIAADEATKKKLADSLAAAATETILRTKQPTAPGVMVMSGCGRYELASISLGEIVPGSGKKMNPATTKIDLASVTKIFTALGIMKLDKEGALALDNPAGKYLPAYTAPPKNTATFRTLLRHTSGLIDPKYKTILEGAATPAQVKDNLLKQPLTAAKIGTYNYSNVGYSVAVLGASAAAGRPLNNYIVDTVLKPLGMVNTTYTPVADCAPTSPDDNSKRVLTCVPQDAIARALAGEAGHAGLFSTGQDMAKFAAELAAASTAQAGNVIPPDIASAMRARQTEWHGTGLTLNTKGIFGSEMSPETFGGFGWTGTMVAVDPKTSQWNVVLTNASLGQSVEGKIDAQFGAAAKSINDASVSALKR